MLKLTLMLICLHSALITFSQTPARNTAAKDSTITAVKFVTDWERNFLDEGISLQKDSLQISDESKRLLLDSEYRKSTYPAKYDWAQAIQLMNRMDLKGFLASYKSL